MYFENVESRQQIVCKNYREDLCDSNCHRTYPPSTGFLNSYHLRNILSPGLGKTIGNLEYVRLSMYCVYVGSRILISLCV